MKAPGCVNHIILIGTQMVICPGRHSLSGKADRRLVELATCPDVNVPFYLVRLDLASLFFCVVVCLVHFIP